jgi:molybdopterin/thiamine biosynthesis adenylyltransferase/rhodanese-related sulfurtransferase
MSEIQFSKEELERYSRHLIIPEFNIEGQRKLKAARVLVIGTGGLGSPLLLYLTAAGIGTIGLVDFDTVDQSNLQRQVLFTVSDVGKHKVDAAIDRLKGLNPHVNFIAHKTRITSENALDIIKDYDVVADGTDNFPTRYLVNDACVLLNKVNVYASIFRFEGQLSVFNYTDVNGVVGPNYRDMFPLPPPPGLVPSCAEGGVIGVLPGILGSLQANEVIKVVSGVGDPMNGRFFIFDAASFETRILKIKRNPSNPLNGDNPTQKGLIDYVQFCGIAPEADPTKKSDEVEEIDVFQLREWMDSNKDFQLIDVREPYEYEIANLSGELIPLAQISSKVDAISRERKVVVHCRSGIRSAKAIRELQEFHGYNNLVNLKGGILAFAKEIDHSIPTY